jgi:integrase
MLKKRRPQTVKHLETIAADKHPLAGSMMKMVLFTGMRRGEMFRLKWSDIDFHRGFINIRDPKGGRDEKVPLNDAARGLLENLEKSSEFVFPGLRGGQRVNIGKQVAKIRDDAGLSMQSNLNLNLTIALILILDPVRKWTVYSVLWNSGSYPRDKSPSLISERQNLALYLKC